MVPYEVVNCLLDSRCSAKSVTNSAGPHFEGLDFVVRLKNSYSDVPIKRSYSQTVIANDPLLGLE